MSKILDVYLNKDLVGKLSQDESGELGFTYTDKYLEDAPFGISLSLPLGDTTYKGRIVRAFFSGLLPDESVRDRLAWYLGISERNPFALLEAVGGDCAGALALYHEGQHPPEETLEAEILDEAKLKDILDVIKRRPLLAGDDGYRLSLAGAQDKLAVRYQNEQVALIKGGAPTTHILKPIITHVKDSAHNELFCMKLAKMVGIDAPETSLHYVEDIPYFLIERYDRHTDENGEITRIHQEDFCQALGIAPEMKYEREGGPDISKSLELIKDDTIRPAADQIKFLNRIIFNFLIGNADAHGKNFSLLYREAKPELAPSYDMISTAVYPGVLSKQAMNIGGKYAPEEINKHDFYSLVPDTKASQTALDKQISTITDKTIKNAHQLKDNLEKEGLKSEIFSSIINVIEQRLSQLQ